MSAVLGRAWRWVRSWGRTAISEENTTVTAKGLSRWTSWTWGGFRHQSDQSIPVEEFWEAQEMLQVKNIEDLYAEKQEIEADSENVSGWWNKFVPGYVLWPRKAEPSGIRRRKREACSSGEWECDVDGDYQTPPPSPPSSASQLISPFRLFVQSWQVEVLPEHYEICFNFLRHLFDLFAVGFLWTVSSPAKLILEVLGIQGALRLWFHGMAMFFVSTIGMTGLLWLIQEYLPQFALIYGIIQALVLSVSVRQNVTLSVKEDEQQDKEVKETDVITESKELKTSVLRSS